METLKFKTNINCSGCVARVTPYLDGKEGIQKWEVDTSNPDKILTIETGQPDAASIIRQVQKAGFRIEPIHK